MPKFFECCECEEEVEVRYLAQSCLRRAGTNNRYQAVKSLPAESLICSACDDGWDGDSDMQEERYSAWGDPLTQPESDWLKLNY